MRAPASRVIHRSGTGRARVGGCQELEDDVAELDELDDVLDVVLDDVPVPEEGDEEAASDFFAEPSLAAVEEEPEERESLR